jgi:hypothetical protein
VQTLQSLKFELSFATGCANLTLPFSRDFPSLSSNRSQNSCSPKNPRPETCYRALKGQTINLCPKWANRPHPTANPVRTKPWANTTGPLGPTIACPEQCQTRLRRWVEKFHCCASKWANSEMKLHVKSGRQGITGAAENILWQIPCLSFHSVCPPNLCPQKSKQENSLSVPHSTATGQLQNNAPFLCLWAIKKRNRENWAITKVRTFEIVRHPNCAPNLCPKQGKQEPPFSCPTTLQTGQ